MCAQSCLTVCNPMDCSPPDFSVHGIFQARILGCYPHLLPQGDLSDTGIKPISLESEHWQVDTLPLVLPGKPNITK